MNDTTAHLDAEQLTETREFLRDVGKPDLAEKFGDELNDRREAVERVAEMRVLREQAQKAGLSDDPAIQALEEHADALADDLGLGPDPHHAERLAEDHDLDEDVVARFEEDDRETLEEALSAIDEVETSARSRGGLAEKTLETHRDRIGRLLARKGVGPDRLVAEDASGWRQELAAALSETERTEANLAESGSDRVVAARLEDTHEELTEEIDEAESALLTITLERRREEIESELADHGVEA